MPLYAQDAQPATAIPEVNNLMAGLPLGSMPEPTEPAVAAPMASSDLAESLGVEPQIQPMPETEVLPDVKMHRKSHPEKILMSHYKLSGTDPDIDVFAKASPLVEKAQDIDKSAMVIAEFNRIGNAYNMLDPKQPITVHAALGVDQYSSMQDLIVFDELNEKTYFKFPYNGENIAIVPADITKFSRIKMSKERANVMFEELQGSPSVVAEFILIPEFADRREPFLYEDTSYWLMLAKVAELRLWSNGDSEKAKLLWFYRDPSYRPEDKANLGTLYVEE